MYSKKSLYSMLVFWRYIEINVTVPQASLNAFHFSFSGSVKKCIVFIMLMTSSATKRATLSMVHGMKNKGPYMYRGPAPFHRLTPNKRFEPVFSTVIMAVCSLFNRMLLLTDLIPLHLLYCGQTVMIGCNHTSLEWTRAVRHIYGIKRHMQGLYLIDTVTFVYMHPCEEKKKDDWENFLTVLRTLLF